MSGAGKRVWKVSVIVVAAVVFGPFLQRWWQAFSFRNRLVDYSYVHYAPAGWSVPEGSMPFRTGRVLVINVTRTLLPGDVMGSKEHNLITVAGAWYKLPSDIRARNPEELGTLIHYSVKRPTEDELLKNADAPARMTVTAYEMQRQVKIGTVIHEFPRKEDEDLVLADLIRKMELRQ